MSTQLCRLAPRLARPLHLAPRTQSIRQFNLQTRRCQPVPSPEPQPTTTSSPSIDPATRPRDLRSQFSSSQLPPPPPTPSNPSSQPTPKRSLRPYIYATFFLLIGMSCGQYVRLIVSPPALAPAFSKEDQLMQEFVYREGSKLPLVKSLSEDPQWEAYDAYSDLDGDERSGRFTTGPLAGARALGGFQRIFANKETGEVIAVVWFGGAVAGWPGVTHGGIAATILDEQFGRCAVRQFPSGTGVTANLDVNYRKPIMTNSYYVVRAKPVKEGFTDKKGWVEGRLETLDGKICVEGKGLFVVPKGYQTKKFAGKF